LETRTPEIRRAVQAPEYEAARRLLREYQAAIRVDLCFQGFEAELADLRARYSGAGRGLWLAWAGSLPLGCVALLPANLATPASPASPASRAAADTAELKRLYVRAEAQGTGLGRALAETVLTAARASGYARVRLETLTRLERANRLYERLGFTEVADFTDSGRASGTRFLARAVGERDSPARRARQLGAQLG
jgi:GNAT superfamily N-acetyltransferase